MQKISICLLNKTFIIVRGNNVFQSLEINGFIPWQINIFQTLCTSRVDLLFEGEFHPRRSDLEAQVLCEKLETKHAPPSTAMNSLMTKVLQQ